MSVPYSDPDPQHCKNVNYTILARNPPDNWLRAGRNTKGFVQSPNLQTGFSSFKMANDFFDCLPNVDVISDGKDNFVEIT